MKKILTGTAQTITKEEALRYLGYSRHDVPTQEFNALFLQCLQQMLGAIKRRAVYDIFPLTQQGNTLNLGFAQVESRDLAKNLQGCNHIAVFAATVGDGVDRLILKEERLSPARGAIMQALGSAAAEDWCDEVNAQITALSPHGTKPRFSCGYGDLDLSLQRSIFAALDVTKTIGVTLGENLFMTPTKSVTALVGFIE
jgi:hypothetical protein